MNIFICKPAVIHYGFNKMTLSLTESVSRSCSLTHSFTKFSLRLYPQLNSIFRYENEIGDCNSILCVTTLCTLMRCLRLDQHCTKHPLILTLCRFLDSNGNNVSNGETQYEQCEIIILQNAKTHTHRSTLAKRCSEHKWRRCLHIFTFFRYELNRENGAHTTRSIKWKFIKLSDKSKAIRTFSIPLKIHFSDLIVN